MYLELYSDWNLYQILKTLTILFIQIRFYGCCHLCFLLCSLMLFFKEFAYRTKTRDLLNLTKEFDTLQAKEKELEKKLEELEGTARFISTLYTI